MWVTLSLAILLWMGYSYLARAKAAQERAAEREREAERREQSKAEMAARHEARVEQMRTSADFRRWQAAHSSAGYDVPASPDDPRWQAIEDQVEADLGLRVGLVKYVDLSLRESYLAALKDHARGLRRLNRVRRTLGYGRVG